MTTALAPSTTGQISNYHGIGECLVIGINDAEKALATVKELSNALQAAIPDHDQFAQPESYRVRHLAQLTTKAWQGIKTMTHGRDYALEGLFEEQTNIEVAVLTHAGDSMDLLSILAESAQKAASELLVIHGKAMLAPDQFHLD